MYSEQTLHSVTAYVMSSFCEHPAIGLGLKPDTCLVERFNSYDPDEFGYFLEGASRRFSIKLPRIKSGRQYLAEVKKLRSLQMGDFVRIVFTRTPEIRVDELTLAELCEIVESGAWPEKYVFPPDLDYDWK